MVSNTFTGVLISSYQISGSSELPMESISFNFAKVESPIHRRRKMAAWRGKRRLMTKVKDEQDDLSGTTSCNE